MPSMAWTAAQAGAKAAARCHDISAGVMPSRDRTARLQQARSLTPVAPGLDVAHRSAAQPRLLAFGGMNLWFGHHPQRDVVLQRKNVVAFGPDLHTGACVDELYCDPDAHGAVAYAARQDMAHAEVLADLAHVGTDALEGEG